MPLLKAISHLPLAIRKPKGQSQKAFTLVELLIVIAVLGILAAAIMVAINPGKRIRQARDAHRKSDINAIANALIGYFAITGDFPMERICDTSRGSHASFLLNCSSGVSSTDWGQTAADLFYQGIVVNQGFLKKLPPDPKNDPTYYYRYEPARVVGGISECSSSQCTHYWIGARMEDVDDPAKLGQIIFRCTDMAGRVGSIVQNGCKEAEITGSFDGSGTYDEL